MLCLQIGTTAPVISKIMWTALMKRLLSISVRTQFKLYHPGVWSTELFWSVEFVFCGTPLQSTHHREQGKPNVELVVSSEYSKFGLYVTGFRRTVNCLYEFLPTEQMNKTTDCLLDDWAKIVYLYSIVEEFANQFKNGKVLIK